MFENWFNRWFGKTDYSAIQKYGSPDRNKR